MSGLVDRLLNVAPSWIYLLVGVLVFVEDAIFVGFVVPGETAAVIGGVAASQGRVDLAAIAAIVVVAAIVGDSVGYEVGKHLGEPLLQLRYLERHRERLDDARSLLARRGGLAVFLGRFVAFFRAVMPALAGISRMRYPKFLAFNAFGGLVWGVGFVLLGYLAGNSYQRVAQTAGRSAALAVAGAAVVVLIVWRWRKHRRKKAGTKEMPVDRTSTGRTGR